MNIIKNLSHNDVDTLISLKRNIDLVKEYNRPLIERKQYGMLHSYYSKVNSRYSGILLQYGLIEENSDELSQYINEISRSDVKSSNKSFEKKYKISSFGEGFLESFNHIHQKITNKAKYKISSF